MNSFLLPLLVLAPVDKINVIPIEVQQGVDWWARWADIAMVVVAIGSFVVAVVSLMKSVENQRKTQELENLNAAHRDQLFERETLHFGEIKKHHRMIVRPLLVLRFEANPDNDIAYIGFENGGVGPALFFKMEFCLAEKEEWRLVTANNLEDATKEFQFTGVRPLVSELTFIDESKFKLAASKALPPNETFKFLSFPGDKIEAAELVDFLCDKMRLRITYSDLYEQIETHVFAHRL